MGWVTHAEPESQRHEDLAVVAGTYLSHAVSRGAYHVQQDASRTVHDVQRQWRTAKEEMLHDKPRQPGRYAYISRLWRLRTTPQGY